MKRQATNSIEAFDICNEAFQKSSHYGTCLQVVPNFSNETLVNCINDMIVSTYYIWIYICYIKISQFLLLCFFPQMTGDHNLTQLHLNTALGQCQAYILLNSTLQSEHPDVTTLIINLCPNNCSNRGFCSEGKLN